MDQDLSRFVGIPWLLGGSTFNGCDCVGLFLLTQRVLYGREIPHLWNYGERDFLQVSLTMPAEMEKLGWDEVAGPQDGDVGYAVIAGAGHLATFVRGAHLTITQYTRSTWKLRRLPFRYFRPKGVEAWQSGH